MVSAILIAAGLPVQGCDMSDQSKSPLVRHIERQTVGRPWGTRISLIPDPFPSGMPKADVEGRLADAGFVAGTHDRIRPPYRHDIARGREVFVREAKKLVCNTSLYVILAFDDHENLTSAEATSEETGCL